MQFDTRSATWCMAISTAIALSTIQFLSQQCWCAFLYFYNYYVNTDWEFNAWKTITGGKGGGTRRRMWKPFRNTWTKDLLINLPVLLLLAGFFIPAGGGIIGTPLAVGLCYTACNAAAIACYAGFGVIFGVGSVPVCSVAQGACMATCWTLAVFGPV